MDKKSLWEENINRRSRAAFIGNKRNYYQINKLDGLIVEFPDWWFNLRGSNTEPLLRLNLEARSNRLMEEKVKEISEIINKN